MSSELAIDMSNLSFAHRKDVERQSLVNLALKRCLFSSNHQINLAFAAGKSTLLQILAGKRLTPEEMQDVFRKLHPSVTFLGTECTMKPVVSRKMSAWDILLLDEVTVDLDVFESETRGATILYATHIFDELSNFPTHFVGPPQRWVPPLPGGRAGPHLHEVALQWLKDDRDYRRGLEKRGRKARGARKDDVPTDSETCYRK
ncbi:hypothetical protein SCHPADRAFT_922775 [Schizopora paradoxa]|uniref:Uncharacterized protein n=1 Tax=Schizopora paradoxa TaxID=27342 RepID=A0A0H2RSH6_9AGAM|nr:hypothetical protein SCHPADRAFT_922775 [Schizopora paradoxa]